MGNFLILVLLLAFSWGASAQDERFFRQLFSGDLVKSNEIADIKKYNYIFHSPYYAVDINRDRKEENLVFVKKDSEDWVEILDVDKKKIFSYKLEPKGFDSELFKIELKTLSNNTDVLLLHYYEGVSKYIEFQGTSRVLAVTIDDRDLGSLKTFTGPSFFDEHRTQRGHYHKRHYQVYLEDLNKDNVKELVVKHQRMSNVFLYLGNGRWSTFKQQF